MVEKHSLSLSNSNSNSKRLYWHDCIQYNVAKACLHKISLTLSSSHSLSLALFPHLSLTLSLSRRENLFLFFTPSLLLSGRAVETAGAIHSQWAIYASE